MLALKDYQRYGRQMILDGFGLQGQLRLLNSSVAVVGAGGLGCPALQYLTAAGVGRIGIIDHDVVELSNLHRQILHRESSIGMFKSESAALAIKQLNQSVVVDVFTVSIDASNALSILQNYDVILDCTDNSPTRYLLSDTAVALGKPLVSGAAQKYEGQLCIYNYGPDGPCYRCLFPKAPSIEMAPSCQETGILGMVTGIIGNLQAVETIKLLCALSSPKPHMLLYSALDTPSFRSVKLRSKQVNCVACGSEGQKMGDIKDTDYVAFCGGERPEWEALGLVEGSPNTRIKAQELKSALDSGIQHQIIDVRTKTEYGICHLPESINIPIIDLVANPDIHRTSTIAPEGSIFVVCRLGNDSKHGVDIFKAMFPDRHVSDLVGGLQAWSKHVDPQFPVY